MFLKKKTKNSSGGFTLVELLLVIAIISMLSSMILASVGYVRARARDGRRYQDIRIIYNAIMLAAQNGRYPLADSPNKRTTSFAGVYLVAAYSRDGVTGAGLHTWEELEASVGQKLPRDPLNIPGSNYLYNAYVDINGRPVTIYRDSATCTNSLDPPGVPFQGGVYIQWLEVGSTNVLNQFINCPFFNPNTHGKQYILRSEGI